MVFNLANANSQIDSQATQMDNIKNILDSVSVGGDNGLSTYTTNAVQQLSARSKSISFQVKENPTFFIITSDEFSLSSTSSVMFVAYNGNSCEGIYSNSTTTAVVATNFSKSYANGILTITSTTGYFLPDVPYYLLYAVGPTTVTTASTSTASSRTKTLSFSGISKDPWGFYIIPTSNITLNRNYNYTIGIVHIDPVFHYWGNYYESNYANTSTKSTDNSSYNYNNGTLTVTLNSDYFYSGKNYKLVTIN